MRSRHLLPALLFLTLALAIPVAGCGSSSSSPAKATTTVPGGADPAAVAVIDGWAKALADGDVQKATSYWNVPSTAENGTLPLTLGNAKDVLAFNESLPCGAELIEAQTDKATGLTLATFKLTDRGGPGGGCAGGVGEKARTIFKIAGGKIADWQRAPDPAGQDSAPPAPGALT
jgi:hypothetical protein